MKIAIGCLLLPLVVVNANQPCSTRSECPSMSDCLQAACSESVCVYTMTTECAANTPAPAVEGRTRREKAGGSIRTDSGNVVVEVAEGKKVGYRVGGEDVIYLNDVPESLRGYADATIDALSLGYGFGELKADAAVTKLKLEMVEANEKIKGEVSTMIQESSDDMDAAAKTLNSTMQAVLNDAAKIADGLGEAATAAAKKITDHVLSCKYPLQFFHVKKDTCANLTVCGDDEYESTPLGAFNDRECTAYTECTKKQYAAKLATFNADRVCKTISDCKKGEVEYEAPTATSDRVCGKPRVYDFGDADKCKGEIETHDIKVAGKYKITASGSAGGDWGGSGCGSSNKCESRNPGGLGAVVSAIFELEVDDVLHILVGCKAPYKGDITGEGAGCDFKGGNYESGGGGGTFVSLNGRKNRNQVLIVGGGGGGGDPHNCPSGVGTNDCRHANTVVTGGGNGNAKAGCGSGGYDGGSNGGAGSGGGCCGSGAAGIDSVATNDHDGQVNAHPFIGTSDSMAGQPVKHKGCNGHTTHVCMGGYGGAGNDGYHGAGGGGGYSGGGAACCDGGGGGSFVNPDLGASPKAAAANKGNGLLKVEFVA